MAKREHPRYENMDWPDWEFREFPMMIYPGAPDPRVPVYHTEGRQRGKLKFAGLVVNDEDELARALAEGEDVATITEDGRQRLTTAEDDRQALIAECDERGLKIDRRWASARLEDAILADKIANGEVSEKELVAEAEVM